MGDEIVTWASEVHVRTKPIPSELRVAVERAERLGLEIYLEDKASAIGTDVLMARVKSLSGLFLGTR